MTDAQRRLIHDAMVRLAHGDRDAFTVVFDGLWPHVLRFVSRAAAHHPDAEDLAQRTLLKIFARVSDLDTSRDGVAWAFGIAAHEVRTLRRQIQRRREALDDEVAERTAVDPTPEDAAIRRDLHEALAESLGELSPSDRSVLLDEGAGASSISPTAWRKRRQRALERLRAVWRRRHA